VSNVKPYRSADYLGDKADVTALVKYAAHLEALNDALLEAVEQCLDDMGESGHCVCEEAKQMLRAAFANARGEP